jgi:hypothetical protein
MPLVFDPGTVTKQDLIDAGYGGPGSEDLNPSSLYDLIIGEGSIGIISSLSDSSMVDGMYTNPSFVVAYGYSDDSIDNMDNTQMGIAVSTYPYTAIFDEPDDSRGDAGNSQVDLFSPVSDFNTPTVEEAFDIQDTNNDLVTVFYASYSADEISGLTSRFGFSTTPSVSDALGQTISNLATEVVQTTLSDRYTFQHTDFYKIGVRNFPLLSLIRDSSMTGSVQNTLVATVSSMGGY